MVGCQSTTSYRFLNMDSEGKKIWWNFFFFYKFFVGDKVTCPSKKKKKELFFRIFRLLYHTIVLQLHCSSHISSRKWFVFCKSFWHFEIWLHQLSIPIFNLVSTTKYFRTPLRHTLAGILKKFCGGNTAYAKGFFDW